VLFRSLMSLLREIEEQAEERVSSAPAVPEGGWSVGHLANHGMLLSCEGFTLKLDLDQLNVLFDIAEDGSDGEVKDHAGHAVYVECTGNTIVLTRDDDEVYPDGVVLDAETLKEMGIEAHEEEDTEEEPGDDDDQPGDADKKDKKRDTMGSDDEEEPKQELEEGVKRAFRRSGKKIKRGFRVTSGYRKGRVVANLKTAYKRRPSAKTRIKLRIAGKKKRLVRILKARRTRRKSLSQRLVRLNKRASGKK